MDFFSLDTLKDCETKTIISRLDNCFSIIDWSNREELLINIIFKYLIIDTKFTRFTLLVDLINSRNRKLLFIINRYFNSLGRDLGIKYQRVIEPIHYSSLDWCAFMRSPKYLKPHQIVIENRKRIIPKLPICIFSCNIGMRKSVKLYIDSLITIKKRDTQKILDTMGLNLNIVANSFVLSDRDLKIKTEIIDLKPYTWLKTNNRIRKNLSIMRKKSIYQKARKTIYKDTDKNKVILLKELCNKFTICLFPTCNNLSKFGKKTCDCHHKLNYLYERIIVPSCWDAMRMEKDNSLISV